MIRSRTQVRASKAPRYFKALCKHFAIKVTVENDDSGDSARVHFPKGVCLISVDGDTLSFACSADNHQALQETQWIIDSHVTKFGELRGSTVEWRQED